MVRTFAAIFGVLLVLAAAAAPVRAANYKVEYAFQQTDGDYPEADLLNVAGTLYGTTLFGGSNGEGTLFSYNPASGTEQLLYAFGQAEGDGPGSNLTNFRGTLYGTTVEGGDLSQCSTYGCGLVFSYNPTTGAEQLVLPFKGHIHGAHPAGSLVQVGGKLYGTTAGGGKFSCPGRTSCGTVFSVDPNTGKEKIAHFFTGGSDGATPSGRLINVGGTLYGTTFEGGGNANCHRRGCGTVFSLDPATGTERVVYAFKGSADLDGDLPRSGVISVGGTLYGTTEYGGGAGENDGTVFSLNPETGVEKVLYSFHSFADGALPLGKLVYIGGKLYGTTSGGGVDRCAYPGCGTVFSLDIATGTKKILHAFLSTSASDGVVPLAGLINVGGTLYGTTSAGGDSSCFQLNAGCGTIFSLTP